MASNENNHRSKQSNSAERVYAEALLEMATKDGKLAEVAQEVEDLNGIVTNVPDAMRLFTSHALSIDARAKSLERIFKGRVSDLVYRFIQVVNQKDRLADMPGIIRAFGQLYDEKEGVIEVDAYLAAKMDDTEANRIATRIGEVLKRKVVLHQYVDPTLIGGLKIRIGDEVIDGSVVAQLKIMKERMIASGLEKARATAGQI